MAYEEEHLAGEREALADTLPALEAVLASRPLRRADMPPAPDLRGPPKGILGRLLALAGIRPRYYPLEDPDPLSPRQMGRAREAMRVRSVLNSWFQYKKSLGKEDFGAHVRPALLRRDCREVELWVDGPSGPRMMHGWELSPEGRKRLSAAGYPGYEGDAPPLVRRG